MVYRQAGLGWEAESFVCGLWNRSTRCWLKSSREKPSNPNHISFPCPDLEYLLPFDLSPTRLPRLSRLPNPTHPTAFNSAAYNLQKAPPVPINRQGHPSWFQTLIIQDQENDLCIASEDMNSLPT